MQHLIRRASVAILATVTVAAGVVITTNSSDAAGTTLIGWAGSWSTGPAGPSASNSGGSLTGFTNQSVRMVVHTSLGGDAVRLRFSNEFGAQAVAIGHATVALPADAAGGAGSVVPGSIHELTFSGGSASTTMYKGAGVVTDPLAWHIAPNSDVVVTIFLPTLTGQTTWHPSAAESTYIYTGDQADIESGAGATVVRNAFYFLSGVDVLTTLATGGIVVLGDSISNGNGATLNGNKRWPDLLSKKINASRGALHEGVLNESLAGNAVTHDGAEIGLNTFGNSGVSRLDVDAFSQINARTVIVELGVNDINFYGDSADRIIEGLRQIANRLRDHGIKPVVCTLGAYGNMDGWTPESEATRLAVNDWIRSQHDYWYVIDQATVLSDPADRSKLLAAYDSGDGIHPNDAGAQVLVDSINLNRL